MKDLRQEIRKILKKQMWLVLSTVDDTNQPHSSVVVYQSDGNKIYIQTGETTIKARNIKNNTKVSITIPFRKNFLHKIIPAPPAELHFTAKAEIISKEDKEAREVLKKFIKQAESVGGSDETIWIRITPSGIISTYGVGIPLLTMMNPLKARNIVHLN